MMGLIRNTVTNIKNNYQQINPQLLQNGIIMTILMYGKYSGFVDISWSYIGFIFSVLIGSEYFLRKFFLEQNKIKFPYAVINTGVGICLFLRADLLIIYLFAALFAVISKYIFISKGRHFLNPSYTAILLMLILFPQLAYTNPLQWVPGNFWPLLIIVLLGSLIITKVKLWDAVLVFGLSFMALLFTFTNADFETLKILVLTGSFFIMMFFGFTDPGVIPKKGFPRIFHVLQITILFFIIHLTINENYAFLFAYVLVLLMEPIFRGFEGKTVMIKNKIYQARNFYQGTTTLALFSFLVVQKGWFAFQHQGNMPEILLNRCNQLICSPEFALWFL